MNGIHDRRIGLLTLVLAAFGALQAFLLLAPGALLMTQMEADVLHVLDAAFRLRDGQVQHVDFSTPLGALSFNALGWLMRLGFAPGAAMAWANVVAMALIVPLALWLHATRLAFAPALGAGLAAMLIAAALTWGGAETGTSYAMFYNRWGWALLIVTLPLMLVPSRGRGDDWVDGLIIGLVAAALFFLKITYAVGLAMIGLAWLLACRRWRAAALSIAVSVAGCWAIMALTGGMEMLGGYMDDMAEVSGNAFREKPGLGFVEVVTRAETGAVAVLLLAGLVALGRAGMAGPAVVWAAASGAVYYIAFQNFGNWPTGALALAFALAALVRRAPDHAEAFGAPARTVLGVIALGLLFSFAPTLLAMQWSLVMNQRSHPATSEPLLADHGAPDLLFERAEGAYYAIDRVGEGAEEDPLRREFAGVVFPPCAIGQGAEALYPALAGALREAGVPTAGRNVMLADAVNPLWYFVGAAPMRGVHLWYYAPYGERLAEVDVLVVPFCALTRPQRNAVIDEAAESGLDFDLALRTPYFAVFERLR